MPKDTADIYLTDPSFREAMRHLQQGHWDAGLAQVARLVERYPLDQGLRVYNQQLQLCARVDLDEKADRQREGWRRRQKAVVRIAIAVLILGLGYWGYMTYSVQLQQDWAIAQENLQAQAQAMELASKFRDALALTRADRPDEAHALLLEIAAEDPNYPGLEKALADTVAATELDVMYANAMSRIVEQDWSGALSVLKDIVRQEPNFKDVPQLIANAEKQELLGTMLSQANAQFDSGGWAEAASAFEGIRALDPTYQSEVVVQRLFESYVNAAQVALLGRADSLEALRIADSLYQRALALRPQDAGIKTDRDLARLYLNAQVEFSKALWDDVIASLETVYRLDPNYAAGAARQMLYEAYSARGDGRMAGRDYTAALSDFERAVVLASENVDAALRLYQAYIKAAEAHAAQKNYEGAVLMYRGAVEAANLEERALGNPNLATALLNADRYADAGNFSVALERYRRAIRIADANRTVVTYVVERGDYLVLIANRFGSTAQAIATANSITNPDLIYTGQVLDIPIVP